jgi:hypothetical protein
MLSKFGQFIYRIGLKMDFKSLTNPTNDSPCSMWGGIQVNIFRYSVYV